VIENRAGGLFESCVEAVAAGATIGEITRAVRINDTPCEPVTPVCITRAATLVKGFVMRWTDSRRAPNGRKSSCAIWAACAITKHARISPAASLRGRLRRYLARGLQDSGSSRGRLCGNQSADCGDLLDGRELPCAGARAGFKALRAKRPDALVVLAGYPQDQVEAHKKAGIDEFIHIRADAAELLGKFHHRLGIE
jgi:hypothetical protein